MQKKGDHPTGAASVAGVPLLHRGQYWLRHNGLAAILLPTFACFAAGEWYRHLFAVVAFSGIFLLLKYRIAMWRAPEYRLLTLLFCCLWVPMAIATFDAEHLERALRTTLRYTAYLFAGVAIVYYGRTQKISHMLVYGCSLIMLLMSLDGIVQWLMGSNLLGYPPFPGPRIVGVFHPHPYLSLFLAVFSPVYYESIRRLSRHNKWAWVALLPLLVVIILGASRTAWMLALIGAFSYGLFLFTTLVKKNRASLMIKTATIALVAGALLLQIDWLEKRVTETGKLFSGDYHLANQATAKRLPLWQNALRMLEENPLTGVGPRGYAASYDRYAPEKDWWRGKNSGQPHMLALEVGAETGLLGLLGYLLFTVLLLNRIRQLSANGELDAIPWGLSALVAIFPLSAAMPFYGYFYAQLLWYPLCIFLALQPTVLQRPEKETLLAVYGNDENET